METYQNNGRVYSVFCEKLSSEEGREYNGYGIKAEVGENQSLCVSDVTDDREALEALVRLCNDEGLDPIHIYDVIEDFLAL